MKGTILITYTLILLLSTAIPVASQLADSSWPMFQKDEQHSGRSEYIGPDNPALLWTFNVNGKIQHSSPVVGADGTIYVGSMYNVSYHEYGKLCAINTDGSLKWSYSIGNSVYSSPVIGIDGTIFIGSYDTYLYAIQPDGTLKWKYYTGNRIGTSPVIYDDGTIYFATQFGLQNNYYLYSLSYDGSLNWRFQTDSFSYSSPVIGHDGTIYASSMGMYGYLFAVKPDGTLKWKFSARIPDHASPAIDSNDTIYIYTEEYTGFYLYAVNPDGTEKWKFKSDTQFSSDSPGIDSNGTIYIGSLDHSLYAINPDGSEKWKFETGSYIDNSSPVIDSSGTVYIGSYDHHVYAINSDGTEKWRFDTKKVLSASPIIDSNGVIYICSLDGYLFAIGETPTATPTMTQTPTITVTATQTATSTDTRPRLDYGKVLPRTGDQNTVYEYMVYYKDHDFGTPMLKRLYFNGIYTTMKLKSGVNSNGWYHAEVPGSRLYIGSNDFYFLFVDDDGFSVRFPKEDSLDGPLVFERSTPTPTLTATMTPTSTGTTGPTITMTVSPTFTPTPTPEPLDCLRITNPSDFYYNTIILSWTPTLRAAYYKIDLIIRGNNYPFELNDNYVIIKAKDFEEWQAFVNIGTMFYRITAFDEYNNMIEDKTDWSDFTCYNKDVSLNDGSHSNDNSADPGCLLISNPPAFDFNTIILSWTPIRGADHYLFENKYRERVFKAIELKENWLRMKFAEEQWNILKVAGEIDFRISAVDIDGNVLDGPTAWSSFVCN